MSAKRPEFWQADTRAVSTGTTSPSTYGEILMLGHTHHPALSAEFLRELENIEAHGIESAGSDRAEVRERGEASVALVAHLREAMRRADVNATAEAAYHLARHVEEWRAGDHTEVLFKRGIGNQVSLQGATRKAAEAKAAKASRRRKPREWLREVAARNHVTAAAVHARIAEREGLTPSAVKQAIHRLRARQK